MLVNFSCLSAPVSLKSFYYGFIFRLILYNNRLFSVSSYHSRSIRINMIFKLLYIAVNTTAVTCNYDNKTYQNGVRFLDGCKTCFCSNGTAKCTPSSTCPTDNKPGRCPVTVLLPLMKKCKSKCESDKDCKGTHKCCPSKCGGNQCLKSIGK